VNVATHQALYNDIKGIMLIFRLCCDTEASSKFLLFYSSVLQHNDQYRVRTPSNGLLHTHKAY
ncbi:hypothetical protein J1N35_025349, partial [Gossypium stocksii]